MWTGMIESLRARVRFSAELWWNHPGFRKVLWDLRRERRMTPEDWEALRIQRLRKLLTFAGRNVPYYRDLFSAIGFDPAKAPLPAGLQDLPLLTKTVIRENFDRLIAAQKDRRRLHSNASGGSTGHPLDFYHDDHYKMVKRALSVYYREWWGIRPWDRTLVLWGGRPRRSRPNVRYFDVFDMSTKALREVTSTLQEWRPRYVVGYSSALSTVAQFIRENRVTLQSCQAVRSAADMLWPSQRQTIEAAFDAPVYNHYGSREINNIAAECKEARRFHLISTWRYVEVVDDDGGPVAEGRPGRITVTDMSNFGMPFVRYVNEDIGALKSEPCSCGQPSSVLCSLMGRITDVIYLPSGEMLHGHFLAKTLQIRGKWFRQFQVYQPSKERLVIRYVPCAERHAEAMRQAVREIEKRVGSSMSITVEICESIPPLHNGKHCYILSDVHRKQHERSLDGIPNR